MKYQHGCRLVSRTFDDTLLSSFDPLFSSPPINSPRDALSRITSPSSPFFSVRVVFQVHCHGGAAKAASDGRGRKRLLLAAFPLIWAALCC